MLGFASFQNRQKFTIYQLIYVINELVSGKKFTNARSLLSSGLLSPGSTALLSYPNGNMERASKVSIFQSRNVAHNEMMDQQKKRSNYLYYVRMSHQRDLEFFPFSHRVSSYVTRIYHWFRVL